MGNQVLAVTGVGDIIASEVQLSGITIAPTNATWALTLTDTAGNVILSLNQLSPAPVFSSKRFTGITCSVFTAANAYIWIN